MNIESINLSFSEFIYLLVFAVAGVISILFKISRWYLKNKIRKLNNIMSTKKHIPQNE